MGLRTNCLGAALLCGLVSSGGALADDDAVYGYCKMLAGTAEGGNVAYISSVYRIKKDYGSGAQGTGIGNSFSAHVDAHYGVGRYIHPTCGTYDRSYQEAEDARNKEVAKLRRDPNWEVRLVDWVYRGDRRR